MKSTRVIFAVTLASAGLITMVCTWAMTPQPQRDQLHKLVRDGNYKEAYEGFSRLALDGQTEPDKVAGDLSAAVDCLQRLSRLDETDEFLEKVIAAHAENWRLLSRAAQIYMNLEHNGYMIAGKFSRGHHRGGGKYVNSYERDRVRALQLIVQAVQASADAADSDRAGLHWQLAEMLLACRGFDEAWRLQYLSDLTELPDYDEGYWNWRGSMGRGAPVDENGQPVYHQLPKSWQDAVTDGQRWRWALQRTMELDPARTAFVKHHFASFLHNQFGVQTMAQYSWFGRLADEERKDTSGTYELHTLGEDETIARLAVGVRRFKLPDEFNFIRIFQAIADGQGRAEDALNTLASIFENRRQYPKAADYWRQSIKRFGQGGGWKTKKLSQIVDPWGMFEPVLTQPAGQGASVEFRFRNGKKVALEAYEIDVQKLLADVKEYIKSNPKHLEWEQINVADIGWRLVQKGQEKYIGAKAAEWSLDLEPRANHFDKRITVSTPLNKAGAYWLVARLAGGNTSQIVIWVADAAIVKKQVHLPDAADKAGKPVDGPARNFYFVADAVTGQPIAKANVEFFGYRQEWVPDPGKRGSGKYVTHTDNFAEFTDADGQLYTARSRQSDRYNWLVMARTDAGKLAYLGFSGVWYRHYYDREYNQTKVFVVTDRPVYRPGQPVKFKFWVNNAKYDVEGKSAYAGRAMSVEIRDPKSERVYNKTFTADEYGGFDGELELAKDATLGVYGIHIPGMGGGHFRVEEYKKPEFEVKVEAPTEPVMLGEKVQANISARYYFGAPVTQAKVKYKVLRTGFTASWYPPAYWDWFYGPGYWWFAYDYTWYPGWGEWGCRRPIFSWWPWHRQQPPELVAEVEAPIGPDGTVKVDIDTAIAKELQGDLDHRYEITAEVTDQSRRTIVGQGTVLVARKPFKVYAWVDRGHYRVGDTIVAHFCAQTVDNKPVKGEGVLRLLKIGYEKDKETGRLKPVETEVAKWDLPTNEEGRSRQQIKASEAGQYRLSYTVTDAKGRKIEGAYVLVIVGEGFDGSEFRFNDIELVPDSKEYKPNEKVKLLINTNREGSTVLLFVRPTDGVYLPPKVLRLAGKSVIEEIEVLKRDMPNFFIEAVTVSGAKVHSDLREIVVPPESRVLDVKVSPSSERYKPGEKAAIDVKLTDPTGEPFSGSVVLSVYDKAVEYISGGSNVPEIKAFFWKWRRHHHPQMETSLSKGGHNVVKPGDLAMQFLGVFGQSVVEEMDEIQKNMTVLGRAGRAFGKDGLRQAFTGGAPLPSAAMAPGEVKMLEAAADAGPGGGEAEAPSAMVEPTVRTQFADTAKWVALLQTNERGEGRIELTMPENLTTWKARAWAMGYGTRCGEGSAEAVTTKDLIIRLQAPRFFVQKDEVVLSANVHNYLKNAKTVKVVLELDGDCLEPMEAPASPAAAPATAPTTRTVALTTTVQIDPEGEKRVDWRVKAVREGQAVVRMKALTDEESDAMEMSFPVYVHGMLKTESFSGAIRPDGDKASIRFRVPAERRPDQSRLEVRYSPSLAAAMVDALPYMVDYPYGCTEQTLNRFIPTVITQRVLQKMGLSLKDIREKRANLNAQEIGDDAQRAEDWAYRGGYMSRATAHVKNPVFDEREVAEMVRTGLNRLQSMQCSDGGWGWFSGYGEQSWPHTTAVVVHGMQIARANDVALVPGVLERGVQWLKDYQARQRRMLENWDTKERPAKQHADNTDALVYMVLADEKFEDAKMRQFLYRDRTELSPYGLSTLGLGLHKLGHKDQRDMVIRNLDQFLVQDAENQSAYLKLPAGCCWWYWWGDEFETQAAYLKLLAATDPKGEKASGLAKFLINNRKHATYWNSTRDTAAVIEALAEYIKAAGEDAPDMTVQVLIDGKVRKEVKIDKTNIFSFDNKLVLQGAELTDGEHALEIVRKGAGPVYFNAYLTNFTLEDPITKAGLEIKVNRKYYRLVPVDKTIKVEGAGGRALDQRVEKYQRQELEPTLRADGAFVWPVMTSGEMLEIELIIESKNDYEYIMFEDMKAAGCEPVALRSGYGGNEMGAYMELRDERVTFFVRRLALGKHSLSYRMRAEIPGLFSALPTKASAMYAPELKANSDEIKLQIKD